MFGCLVGGALVRLATGIEPPILVIDYLEPCRGSIGWGLLAKANDQSGMSFGNFPHTTAIVLAMKHMEFCPAHHI